METIRVLVQLFMFAFGMSVFGQSVSGIVKNLDNEPIANALVSEQGNPSVWTKTDEEGVFSIALNLGDKIKVAAFDFETVKNVSVTSVSGLLVVMEEDLLLSTDEFHLSFDHMRPGSSYSKDEAKKDLPTNYTKSYYVSEGAEDHVTIDHTESIDSGGASIKMKYPKGKVGTGDSGSDCRIFLSRDPKNAEGFTADDLYMSYWIKFEAGTDFRCGGKMPSLGGSFYNAITDKNATWKGRIMWRKGGAINMYMELPHDQPNMSDDDRMMGSVVPGDGCIPAAQYTKYITDGDWHNVELHYVLEQDGNAGSFECWIDGGVGYKYLNSSVFNGYKEGWPGLERLTVNTILLSTFYGGSNVIRDAPFVDTYSWIDEVRVSRSRINDYSTYRGTVTSTVDDQESNKLVIYPNPSVSGFFSLQTVADWTAMNSYGQEVAKGSGKIINLSKSNAGVYFINVGGEIQRVVVQ